MNIFWREMKAYRKSIILWSIGVFLMVVSGMSKYAGLSSSGQSMSDMMADMPKSMQAIMDVGDLDLNKASGYYGILFLYLLLMAAIHAAMLGANIIAKEERDKTSEFLFVKPLSRTQIITSKLVAALVNLVILNVVTLISSIVIVGNYSKGESVTSDIFMTMVGLLIVQLLFMVIGSAIASVKRKPKTAGSLSTGILLLTFVLSIAIDLNEKLEGLKYITPFKYFEAKNVMYGGGLDPVFVLLSAAIIAALVTVTYVYFKKRDLNG
ncbi:ABC transporter permease subunit [Paenibacillus sp. sgz500958]|uniref:ABC transporter permease subunit n=1 Tax=Paenibacillus sp. sgz500958 TaxID=3242475 RepID=UPI0036D2EE05